MVFTKKRRGQQVPARKRAASKPSYGKRTYPYKSSVPSDGQKLMVSTYFEIEATQPSADANGGTLGYSIQLDPTNCLLTSVSTGNGMTVSKRDGTNAVIADGSSLTFGRLAEFQKLYRQFRVDSCSIKITTDRICGLDNPLICLTDRGDATPCSTVGTAMTQAHKSTILTESSRTMNYGWKPSTPEEREYCMITQGIGVHNQNYIKVLQEVETKSDAVLKHKVELMFTVTLKDSKSLN